MKTFGSRPLYFGGILLIILNISVFTYAFFVFFEKGQEDAVLALAIFNGVWVIILIFYLRRYVYLINTENGNLICGNLFFKMKIHESEVAIKEFAFIRRMFKLKMKGKTYYFVTLPTENPPTGASVTLVLLSMLTQQ
jgi:hypothetical protein